VTLGDLDGPGSFSGNAATVRRDSRGRYLVLVASAPVPLLFDSTGKFIAAVAREGQGPGEIRRAFAALFGRGDTVLIPEQGSLSVFSPELGFVRKVQTAAFGSNYTVLPDGNLFLLGGLRTPGGEAFQYHVISTDGRHIRSFVELDPPAARPPGAPIVNAARMYALSRQSGEFWSHSNLEYRFTLNDSVGIPRRVWEGSSAWFTETQRKGQTPLIWAVREDSRRILWVMGLMPGPGYREPIPDATGTVTGAPSGSGARISALDAIDLETGALLASARIPLQVNRFVDDERIAVLTEVAGGIPRTEVWRFRLSGFQR
jgi:hypothetical protein